MELFIAVPKLPDIVIFVLFLQIYIFLNFQKTLMGHFFKG